MNWHTIKLTDDNQGYWDRIKRARSWVNRARAAEISINNSTTSTEFQELFIMYWIAFNALYGRVNESRHGRYLRPGDDDAKWFLRRMCDLDAGTGRISQIVPALRKDAHALFKSRYLSEYYWREGYSLNVKGHLEHETATAEEALKSGDLYSYLEILLWKRIRVLRNQIFHGCSTHRDSLNKDAIEPAVLILSQLIPIFLDVMEDRCDKENEWPKIPFPRRDSPQHPSTRGNR